VQRTPRVIPVVALALLVASPLLAVSTLYQPAAQDGTNPFRTFTSYMELRSFVLQGIRHHHGTPLLEAVSTRFTVLPEQQRALLPTAGLSGEAPPRFSKTNIQVEGVDEPDIVKTDGRYLYVSTANKVFIILAHPPQQLTIVSKLEYTGGVVGMFVTEDRLAVIIESGLPLPQVTLKIYDISDRSTPLSRTEISLEGSHLDSRLLGGHIYSIIQQPAVKAQSRDSFVVTTPTYTQDGRQSSVDATSIYFNPNSSEATLYTVILSIRITDGQLKHRVVLTGWGSTIYASPTSIYVAMPEYGGPITTQGLAFPDILRGPITPQAARTSIHKVAIRDGEISMVAKNTIPGTLLNQFSMDEYRGYLRVATTAIHWKPDGRILEYSNLYILDEGLKVVGSLEGLAPNEKIYSVRFMGERAYIVTFKKVDPLFAISLEEPSRPTVIGELKIPGFSQYLHPIEEGYLLGIGKEAVEASQGDFAWFQGLKLSIFRVGQDGNPVEVAKYLIGDRGTDSPVLHNHKAFLYDPQTKILVIPVLLAQLDRDRYGESVPPHIPGAIVWQGAYVLKVVRNEGFQLLGRVTHLKPGNLTNYELHIMRAVFIESYLYTVSGWAVKAHSLPGLTQVAEIQLA
jgi:uncharacterized secreted protein with C-terminal beta-propeller domain